ncbi:hypothetical protein NEMIN01_0539 [Nematocida minor]|uniref:uncharacterized protein n=1 Tax=Nematocida minor TaxID=1912983 RepID=UPI0022206B59|nr:uncharacterized protein NEMIN01_0539 [Nematocida minor]KAI5189476.1 hypothetical protein NEMIN01_0539 [Nematocida minor]
MRIKATAVLLVLGYLDAVRSFPFGHHHGGDVMEYGESGLPKRGLLYNYGSHGYISMAKKKLGFSLGGTLAIEEEDDLAQNVVLFQPVKGVNLYILRIIPPDSKVAGDDVIAIAPSGLAMKIPIDEQNPFQNFQIAMTKRYPGAFQIVFGGVMCLTPERDQFLIPMPCFAEDSRVFNKQVFQVYPKNAKDTKPIIVKKGIEPYYFKGCAPCSKSIPDQTNGKYILVNSKFCDENCRNSDDDEDSDYHSGDDQDSDEDAHHKPREDDPHDGHPQSNPVRPSAPPLSAPNTQPGYNPYAPSAPPVTNTQPGYNAYALPPPSAPPVTNTQQGYGSPAPPTPSAPPVTNTQQGYNPYGLPAAQEPPASPVPSTQPGYTSTPSPTPSEQPTDTSSPNPTPPEQQANTPPPSPRPTPNGKPVVTSTTTTYTSSSSSPPTRSVVRTTS